MVYVLEEAEKEIQTWWFRQRKRVREITPEIEETLVRLIREHKRMEKHLERISTASEQLGEEIGPIASHGPPLKVAQELQKRDEYRLGESHMEMLRAVGDVLRYLPGFPIGT